VSRIEVWTDGGCQGNPGPGGWAYIVISDDTERDGSGFESSTTNNRMELTAVREALASLAAVPESTPIIVHTDSQYVQKGITAWIHTWERNGWRTSGRQPVKNSELWLAISDLSRGRQVQWVWVMGHAGDEKNDRCDRLVQEAIARGLKRAD